MILFISSFVAPALDAAEKIFLADTEAERKKRLCNLLCLLSLSRYSLDIVFFLILSAWFYQPGMLVLALWMSFNLPFSLLSLQLNRRSAVSKASWLLVLGNFIPTILLYGSVGVNVINAIPAFCIILIALLLLRTAGAVLVTSIWIVWVVVFNLVQVVLKIYTPIVELNNYTSTSVNIYYSIIYLPFEIGLLIYPAKAATRALRMQNQRMQQVLLVQQRNEARLRENEQRFRATFEQAAVGISHIGLDGQWLQVNQKLCDIVGYSPAEMQARTLSDLTHPDDHNNNLFRLCDNPAGTYTGERRFIHKNGSIIWVSFTASLVRDDDGQPVYFISIVLDITPRMQAEEQVRFQASLLDQVRNAIVASDQQGQIVYINRFAEELFQVNRTQAVGKPSQDVIRRNADSSLLPLQDSDSPGSQTLPGLWEGESILKLADGRELPFMGVDTVLRDEQGRLKGYVSVAVDLSERKQVEEALAAEKERLAVTLRSIGDGVITTDTSGLVTLINPVAEKLTGWALDDAVGQPLQNVFNLIDSKTRQPAPNPAQRVLETGQIVGLGTSTALVARDGEERFISNSGAPIRDRWGNVMGVVLVFRDISERQRMEEELRKSQKLESLGILAGGIAHDFNNILTAIAGNISLAKLESDPAHELYELLTEAESATFRAKDLTQQLLTFSKGGAPIKRIASLKELLEESTGFALRGSNVRSHYNIGHDLWPVEMDVGQINQVINNLVINADQAMPRGGRLFIEAVNIGPEELDQSLPLKPGEYVRVSVQDEGIGISPKNLPRIFDPYFTTKQKGSGLGLATSFSIIRRHGGHISVSSKLDKGTTFTFYLPASPTRRIPQRPGTGELQNGRGKILLMDDDRMIREVGQRALTRLGYSVEVATDGEQAIELYRRAMQSSDPFGLVIMDLTIPGGMGGKDTIVQLLKLDPEVKAIVSSGYSNDPVMANYQAHCFKGVLTKPFRLEELSQKVERVLNAVK